MAILHENPADFVPYAPPDSDELEEIQELNLLFLMHLRSAARDGADCLGLPAARAGILRSLSMSKLESMAEFPRSLFVIDLDRITVASEPRPAGTLAQARQALALTVLHSAWTMSRRRDFHAKLFLRLSTSALRRLRTTSLSELPLLATSPTLLRCGFAGADSLWNKLLMGEPTIPRTLRLIALHPDFELHRSRRILAARSGE